MYVCGYSLIVSSPHQWVSLVSSRTLSIVFTSCILSALNSTFHMIRAQCILAE